MIKSFADPRILAFFEDGKTPKHIEPFAKIAARKLSMVNAARQVEDLRIPPANRLEKLTGDRAGTWSIRINNQWRVCFRFEDGNAYDVEIVDYH